jgi:hypothetical protein
MLTAINARWRRLRDAGNEIGTRRPHVKERDIVTRRTPIPSEGPVMRFRDRIFDDKRHDPYEPAGKYPEPTRCKDCGAVYHKGHWQWGKAPEDARADTCPACRRIADRLPAGTLTLAGAFLAAHRADLLHLVKNEAEHERTEIRCIGSCASTSIPSGSRSRPPTSICRSAWPPR